jgi:tRNA pseudouridine38-40 synthase
VPSFRLTLAYDGTDFQGWQLQTRPGARTVQGVLEAALQKLSLGRPVRVHAAGRTDAGAHALGQVVGFLLEREFAQDGLLRAVNGLLPPDVRALRAEPVSSAFHPRRDAVSKHYRYSLDTGGVQLPQRRRFAGHVPFALDAARVRTAAGAFLGRHDFASLQTAGGSVQTTIRTVSRSEARFDDAALTFDVEADGFLRQMVRSMVGGLTAVGRGAWSVADLERALERRDRRAWPAPAEARGLTLVRVRYPGE